LDLKTPTQTCKQIDSVKDTFFEFNKDKFFESQTSTQKCKQIDSDIQTEKGRHFRHPNQQRQILGLANTNPDMQTSRFRHTNRERQAL
jgi:hypothetical protein